MRKWLIVILILACGFFLFEPLLENFLDESKHTSGHKPKYTKCENQELYKDWQKKLKAKYNSPRKYKEMDGDDLANRICKCISKGNDSDKLCECMETNRGIYTDGTEQSGNGNHMGPNNLRIGCDSGHFKCSCCPSGGNKCQMGTTVDTYNHSCINCKGEWHYTDNTIDIDEDRPQNSHMPYATSQ